MSLVVMDPQLLLVVTDKLTVHYLPSTKQLTGTRSCGSEHSGTAQQLKLQ